MLPAGGATENVCIACADLVLDKTRLILGLLAECSKAL